MAKKKEKPERLSLRDYFAARAMAALIVAGGGKDAPELTSDRAYAHADALLAKRSKA